MFRKHGRNHVITSKVEHPAVLEVCRFFEEFHGIVVTYLDVDRYGMIDVEELKSKLTEKTSIGMNLTINSNN
jgi:cysteine desulfurase